MWQQVQFFIDEQIRSRMDAVYLTLNKKWTHSLTSTRQLTWLPTDITLSQGSELNKCEI
jgi:hypothetical protein